MTVSCMTYFWSYIVKKKAKDSLYDMDGSGELAEAMVWLKAAIIVAAICCVAAVVWGE